MAWSLHLLDPFRKRTCAPVADCQSTFSYSFAAAGAQVRFLNEAALRPVVDYYRFRLTPAEFLMLTPARNALASSISGLMLSACRVSAISCA